MIVVGGDDPSEQKKMAEGASPTSSSKSGGRWTLANTQLLLQIRDEVLEGARQREPHRKASMTLPMWNTVANRIREHDPTFEKDGAGCRSRFNNMKTAYRGKKDRIRLPQGLSGDGGPRGLSVLRSIPWDDGGLILLRENSAALGEG